MSVYTGLKQAFRGKDVPDELSCLADFVDDEDEVFCGTFELRGLGDGALKPWISPNLMPQFFPFGLDGLGSVFALWAYKNQDPSLCPVVYLAAEGGTSRVIAADCAEFLKILAWNRDWEPFDNEFQESDPETMEANRTYRRWLKVQMRLDRGEDPQEMADAAAKAHPDLGAWLREHRE